MRYLQSEDHRSHPDEGTGRLDESGARSRLGIGMIIKAISRELLG
jgi:hypothetical protein